MEWRDLFYFSKGERQALIVLLSLVASAWMLVIHADLSRQTEAAPTDSTTLPTRTLKEVVSTQAEKPFERKRAPFQQKNRRLSQRYPKTVKYPVGTQVDLNQADTLSLKKVPGIGSVFANRIVKYRNLLGGYYSVEQLREVYGIDEERYESLKSWFRADPSGIVPLRIHELSAKELSRHPYINYKQARSIERLVRRKGKLQGWEELSLLEEFPEKEIARLRHYLSFQ